MECFTATKLPVCKNCGLEGPISTFVCSNANFNASLGALGCRKRNSGWFQLSNDQNPPKMGIYINSILTHLRQSKPCCTKEKAGKITWRRRRENSKFGFVGESCVILYSLNACRFDFLAAKFCESRAKTSRKLLEGTLSGSSPCQEGHLGSCFVAGCIVMVAFIWCWLQNPCFQRRFLNLCTSKICQTKLQRAFAAVKVKLHKMISAIPQNWEALRIAFSILGTDEHGQIYNQTIWTIWSMGVRFDLHCQGPPAMFLGL